jgi:hypothetical protein
MFLLLGLDAGVVDSDFYKSIYDDTLEEGEFNQICSYFIELADPPDGCVVVVSIIVTVV